VPGKSPDRRSGKLKSLTLNVGAFSAMTVLGLALVEGFSSLAVAVRELLREQTTEASQYDELIGWVGIPGAAVPDLYGDGEGVRHDSRGFRGDVEVTASEPDGQLRIVCSGDSFTYGQGVANREVWCHLLSQLDPRIQTVNLGQPGYGLDQIFLRYKRDASTLEHSIHLIAVVEGDFERMAWPERFGYGKPVLSVEADTLAVRNVPVPRLPWTVARILERAELRMMRVAQRLVRAAGLGAAPSGLAEEEVRSASQVLFRTLASSSDERGIVPVVIYLPTQRDLDRTSEWRSWLAEATTAAGLPFLDLAEELEMMGAAEAGRLFIPPFAPVADGHYTEAGNAWVARVVLDQLLDHPTTGVVLRSLEPETEAP